MPKKRPTKPRQPKPATAPPVEPDVATSPTPDPTTPARTRPQRHVEPSHCPRCGSTNRRRYHKTDTKAAGHTYRNRTYTHVVRRWTFCADCGQARVDISHENRPG